MSGIKKLFEEKNYSIIYLEYTGYSNQDTQPSYQSILKNVDGIAHIELDEEDVVRHRLVKAIIKAYDKEHQREEEREQRR